MRQLAARARALARLGCWPWPWWWTQSRPQIANASSRTGERARGRIIISRRSAWAWVPVAGTQTRRHAGTAVDSSQRFASAWRTPDLSDPAVLLREYVDGGRRAAGAGRGQQQAKQHGGRAIRDDFHASFVSAERGRKYCCAQERAAEVQRGRGRA